MSANIDHPCFNAPGDVNIKIWRYMDFTKFVSLLEKKCLFLSRVDMFDDPYEGATSHANSEIRPFLYKDQGLPPNAVLQMSMFMKMTRQWTYVNCWHMNQSESAAMWKLYAQTNEAVAIQSTFSKLHQSLPSDTYLGKVNYIDYDKDWLPEGNAFRPYVHKRRSFEHEKELRVLMQDLPSTGSGFDHNLINIELGKSIEINLSELIEHVYVSPTAPNWFYDVVCGVSKRYGYEFDIKQSKLSRNPVFC